ncbi:alcohol oxidase, partial [Aureobasidium melanogenum]
MWRFAHVVALLVWVANCISSPLGPFAPHAIVLNHTEQVENGYDYVIVGGGTSGLVVANRLTENPSIKVLVIERGYLDGQDNGTTVPGLAVPNKYLNTDTSIPQPGLNNRTAPLYTGDVVGGGTVVNGMFFARGARADYDAWEQLGNPGWGWDGLLPYFRKSETFTPPIEAVQEMFPGIISRDLEPHGIDGPMGSSFPNYQYPVIKNFFTGREIIMAAGAARTPQILQLSGIGPEPLLSHLGIETVVGLPGVGSNFQDQPTLYMQFSYGNYTFPTPDWILSNASWAAEQLAIYYENRTGPMTVPYLSGSTVAFLPLQNITAGYQSIINSTSSTDYSSLLPLSTDPSITSGYEEQIKLLQSLYVSPHAAVAEIAWEGGDTLPLAIIRPSSRGAIYINTTDPLAAPVINFNTFSHPMDMAIAIASVKKIREWASSPPMQALGIVETFPGRNVLTDAEIEEAIRSAATSSWQHPSSTTAMMKREWGGVVDAELRVYGTKGLRIVDAGVFPMVVAGHSSSSVYAVAEKAADIIKATW